MTELAYHFSILINPEEYLKYYSGMASTVRTETLEGVVIEFPASSLKPWVTRAGISGTFRIRFDESHRLLGVDKVN